MKLNGLLVAGGCLALFGCQVNPYAAHYSEMDDLCRAVSVTDGGPVVLKKALGETDLAGLLADGYVAVGQSSFAGPYAPLALAVDVAGERGASLVLLDIRYKESRRYTSVEYLPTVSAFHDYGYASGPRRGRSRSYFGGGSVTTYNPVAVERSVDIYEHVATFFRRIDAASTYGIQWAVPRRLPTEGMDAPVRVRVNAVMHGTSAERAGIRSGQVVKSVNGVPIRTRRDLAPFLERDGDIREVEVEDAE